MDDPEPALSEVEGLAPKTTARTWATSLQSLKQSVARRRALRAAEPFWQARYYDFNVWSERKFTEKLRYIHRNPVTRGLVDRPEHWPWSSFRHYLTGEHCGVEIESRWTARARERLGIFPTVQTAKKTPAQAELERGTLDSRGDN
jgi:putative transposase